MVEPYYFHVFPVHPFFEQWESPSSHIIRLIEENMLDTVWWFTTIINSNSSKIRLDKYNDFPLDLNSNLLPIYSACNEQVWLNASFYPLIHRFNKLNDRHHISLFLKNVISKHLRYCPYCVKEKRYYSILWRFLLLPGCPEHKCYLLDKCTKCGQDIPILPMQPKIGICPNCGNQIEESTPAKLSQSDLVITLTRFDDLCFLLSPITASNDTIVPEISEILNNIRHEKGISENELSMKTGIPIRNLYGIENNDNSQSGKFLNYVNYLDFFGISFREALSFHPSKPLKKVYPVFDIDTMEKHEHDLFLSMREVIAEMRIRNEMVNQKRICEKIGISVRTLRRYPGSRALLANIAVEEKNTKKEINNLVLENKYEGMVLQAIQFLQENNEIINVNRICERLNMSESYLRKFPKVNSLFKTYAANTKKKSGYPNLSRETDLLEKVQRAVIELEEKKENPSPDIIAKYLLVSRNTLNRYPKVRDFLKKYVSLRAERIEQNITRQILSAIDEIKSEGRMVIQNEIANKLHMPLSTLKTYFQPRLLLKRIGDEEKAFNRFKDNKKRGEALLTTVQNVIKNNNLSLDKMNFMKLAESVGVSLTTLKSYRVVYSYLTEGLGFKIKPPKRFIDDFPF